MTDFFGDTGWDGNLDDLEPAPEAVAVTEAEPAVETAPEETPEAVAEPQQDEPVSEERERDEQGRFLPKKIEVDDPQILALLDKYQGDPVKALRAAVEAQQHIGSLNNELGQLRPLAEKLEQIEARLSTPQTVPTQITEDLIERDPARATQLAFEQGNQTALAIAYETWKDEDPASAAVWVVTQQQQIREQALEARINELQSQITPVTQQHEDALYAQAVREFVAAEPGVIDRIQTGAATLDPHVAQALYAQLENGTQAEKIGAFKALAELTKGRADQPATPEQVRNLAREAALAADEAIAGASVVSATATKSEPAGKTLADTIGEEWNAIERPLADGWNIGT